MELELGLKLIRTREDDVSSSTDFKVSRDSLCQVSPSRETDSVFILTLHVKGFKKKGIDMEINDEGDRITISGRKKVEEMVLVKWVEWKKETEIQEFKKVFRIPRIVNLDKIKARFSEEDETLTVTFPKKVKGITGLKIEEEEEETEEKTEPEEEKTEEITEPEEEKTEEITEPDEEIKEETIPEEEEEKIEEEIVEEEETKDHEEESEEKESKPKKKKRKKFRFPCVAGSTLLLSIIVFIIQLIQSKGK
ncbi:SHSP domain-containing protein [Hirschfeldia incana]|nr:SHSP domain-containing protein [Hirschfeldia incana]